MQPKPLRDYQVQSVNELRGAFRKGHRAALLVKPTGAGKTRTAAEMVQAAHRKGTPTLWLADRLELVEQASEAFTELGIPHGLILPGHQPHEDELILCGTIQSFLARYRRGTFHPEHIRLICLDEAHRAESNTYQQLLHLYPNARVVGLTATPVRGDGKGLGRTFTALVQPISTRTLMDRGYLVPPRYFIPSELDLVAAQANKRGDFTRAELDAIADRNPQLIGDVVETFARVCPDRRAVAFPCNIRHSLALRDAFNSVGIPAVHIDGQTPREERRDLMAAFRSGEYQILTSVNIAIEGLDVPDVSAVIMARPTRSERIWIQAVGRGLRTSPGKADCIVLDHAGVMLSLGPAEDYQDWTLGTADGQQPAHRKPAQKRDPKEITCEECHAVFYAARICPACGHEHTYERAPRDVETASGDLQELTKEGRKALEATQEEKKAWWAGLQWYVAGKGWKAGAAYRMYVEKFGVGPGNWQKTVPPAPPSAEVQGWIRHRNIAFARRRDKEQHVPQAAD